jgi:hypothetical protein
VRVFKNTWFARFARKEGIGDDELKAIASEVLEAGLAETDYGGGVYKVRVARPGEGKSGGYRVIVFFRSGDKTFFHYGFAKSDRGNISRKELKVLKKEAKKTLVMSDKQVKERLAWGTLLEII